MNKITLNRLLSDYIDLGRRSLVLTINGAIIHNSQEHDLRVFIKLQYSIVKHITHVNKEFVAIELEED